MEDNIYLIDGKSQPTLELFTGNTYMFDFDTSSSASGSIFKDWTTPPDGPIEYMKGVNGVEESLEKLPLKNTNNVVQLPDIINKHNRLFHRFPPSISFVDRELYFVSFQKFKSNSEYKILQSKLNTANDIINYSNGVFGVWEKLTIVEKENGFYSLKNADNKYIRNLQYFDTNKGGSLDLNVIDNYDGLIIRSATKVRKDLIDSLSNLKIIGRAGAGVDNVDVEAAKNKNIIVMNTPGGNTNATAEHTIGLIFALQRKITVANETTHNGLWEKKKLKGNEIKGKKIGIVGFGNVGKRVAEISNVLGMHVSIFSSYFETIKDSYPEYNSCSIDEIIKDSDIISFHCKPNKDGNPIMNKNHLSLMKKNCIIINTARGNLVDEDDLKNALEKKEIKGAALDVFKNEPLEESGFYNLDNIILTPHIAASTDEAQIVVAEMVANQFVEFFNNNKIINSVT